MRCHNLQESFRIYTSLLGLLEGWLVGWLKLPCLQPISGLFSSSQQAVFGLTSTKLGKKCAFYGCVFEVFTMHCPLLSSLYAIIYRPLVTIRTSFNGDKFCILPLGVLMCFEFSQ